MKTLHLTVAVCGLLLASLTSHPASADVFNMGGTRNADGSWTGLASLETVPVGDAGNVPDTRYEARGFGRVNYDYRIGKYEVTAGQYCEFLNKVAGVDTYGLYNPALSWYGCGIERFAGNGTTGNPNQYRVAPDLANRPVNCVSFGDACRFANWLHNGQPSGPQNLTTTEDGAYLLNGATSDTALAAATRKAGWKWAVTSQDEWYKAAYYKGGSTNAGYWTYATGSNSLPSNKLLTPDGGNNANFYQNDYTIWSPSHRTPVGEFENSESPYGTFDQCGNVAEWNEGLLDGFYRAVRDASYADSYYATSARTYYFDYPSIEDEHYGFRVVQVPEPATLSLLALGGLLLARRRRA